MSRRWSVLALLAIIGAGLLAIFATQRPVHSQVPRSAVAPLAELRLRIAWGGGEPRVWRGAVSVSQGELSQPRLLGIEADEPGSIWQSGSMLRIDQPRPRSYDGVDVTIRAPLDATLTIDLHPLDEKPNEVSSVRIPMREMVNNYYNGELDALGNRLLVRRDSGDMLRVQFDTPSLIVNTGSLIRGRLHPFMLPAEPGTEVQLRLSVTGARDDRVIWSDRRDVRLDASGSAEELGFEFNAPAEEAAYSLHVEAVKTDLRTRLGLKQTIARRTLQFLALAEAAPSSANNASPNRGVPDSAWAETYSVDLASSDWWSRLARWPLANANAQPFSSGESTRVSLPTRQGDLQFTVLPPAKLENLPWEAVPLRVDNLGQPHFIEVEFPADAPQILGISILEPNAAGRLVPIGLDSGLFTPEALVTAPSGEVGVHRLVFWPRTKHPLLLITNQSNKHEGYFGKIRLLSGPRQLPAASTAQLPSPGTRRQWLAYFEKPLFLENFGASEALDEWSGRSLDDWQTFHEGVTRLGEYLNYNGQTGAIITVATDGTALFPGESLPATPRFDTGAFFDSSQDPLAKDVLELLLREFDRRDLNLIPSIDFATRIPAIEQLARGGEPDTASLFWIGANGRWLPAELPPDRGRAPYYNLLDPRVQEAMLAIIRETGRRACRHASFQGLGIRLGVDGFAQLPGPEWGLDDQTVARFESETGIALNVGTGSDRFVRRRDLLLGPHLAAWLKWRADQVTAFYDRAARELRELRPDARLYLLATGALASPASRMRFHPVHSERNGVAAALLEAGLSAELLAGNERISFLQPERIQPENSVTENEIAEADAFLATEAREALDSAFAKATGSIFFHPPQEFRLPSFEQASPYPGTSAWVVSQVRPSGFWNQRRLAHLLASRDLRTFAEGGWLLPLGEDEGLNKMLAAFCQLPDAPFATLEGNTQPVVIRTWQSSDRTCCYMVNNSPWPVRVTLQLRSASDPRGQMLDRQGTSFLFRAQGEVAETSFQLGPYDLQGAWLWAADLQVLGARVEVQGGSEVVQRRLEDLTQRVIQLGSHSQPPLPLTNGDFEERTADGKLPGWGTSPGGVIEQFTGRQVARHGNAASLFRAPNGSAYFISDPIPPPPSGRLAVSTWLKLAPSGRQPALRIAIVGELNGQPYYRYAPVGGLDNSSPLKNEWGQYFFHVQDLPTSGLENLRVRFDMMAPGEVAIDDVQIFDKLFSQKELVRLSSLITRAQIDAENGRWSDCLSVLEGYWPKFLLQHVNGGEPTVADTAPAAANSDETARAGLLEQVIPSWLKWR